MEGIEFIKKSLEKIKNKIKKEEKESVRYRECVKESDNKLKKLYAQKEELEELIKPYLAIESIEGKKNGK